MIGPQRVENDQEYICFAMVRFGKIADQLALAPAIPPSPYDPTNRAAAIKTVNVYCAKDRELWLSPFAQTTADLHPHAQRSGLRLRADEAGRQAKEGQIT